VAVPFVLLLTPPKYQTWYNRSRLIYLSLVFVPTEQDLSTCPPVLTALVPAPRRGEPRGESRPPGLRASGGQVVQSEDGEQVDKFLGLRPCRGTVGRPSEELAKTKGTK